MIDEQLGSLPINEDTRNPKELFEIKNVEGKTELTANQVLIISKLKILASYIKKRYNLDFMETFVKNFLTLQLSKDRASRKEYVSAYQSRNDERAGSLLDKFNVNLGK